MHEFKVEHKVTYRGYDVPVDFHDSEYDSETREYEQRAFMMGVDLVLDSIEDESKDGIEVSVYTTRSYQDVNATDVWHHTEDKILFLQPSGVYGESMYDPTSRTETGFRLIGKLTVLASEFRIDGTP